MVMLADAASSAMIYEQGNPGMLVTIRPLPGLPARGTATSSPIRPADTSGGTHA
jgi:hypothetical protein